MKKILILGAGLWQVPYLRKAKEMGLYVCATDWSESPEGIDYVDVFRCISVRDKEQSLAFAIENNIDAVFTNSDVAVPTAAYIAEILHLPCYSQKQAEIATNKYQMRNFIKSIGLHVPEYYLCHSRMELLEKFRILNKKAIVKPIDNCGSRGVYIVENEHVLFEVAQDVFENSFSGEILLEEFMIGNESSVEVLVENKTPMILGWCRKKKSPEPYRVDLQLDYFPDASNVENQQVEEMVQTLVDGLQLENGIMHVEFMWTPDGIKIIEFALRGCGSNVITHLMPTLRGLDIMQFLLNKSLGNDASIRLTKNLFGTLKFIIPHEGVIKSVSGIEQIWNVVGLIDFYTDLKEGYQVDTIKNGRLRPGYFIVNGNSKEDVVKKISQVEELLQIEYV